MKIENKNVRMAYSQAFYSFVHISLAGGMIRQSFLHIRADLLLMYVISLRIHFAYYKNGTLSKVVDVLIAGAVATDDCSAAAPEYDGVVASSSAARIVAFPSVGDGSAAAHPGEKQRPSLSV